MNASIYFIGMLVKNNSNNEKVTTMFTWLSYYLSKEQGKQTNE